MSRPFGNIVDLERGLLEEVSAIVVTGIYVIWSLVTNVIYRDLEFYL